MNSLEASRVLSVLDETLEEASLLSYVTTEVLETVEQLQELLGGDLMGTLLQHRNALATNAKENRPTDATNVSTWELLRMLVKSPATGKLQRLHTERSVAMLQFIEYVEKLRHYAQKRLTTTVEEDSSNREYYEEVKEREERAVAEKIQLEQKLKLQRVELHKQTNQMQTAADRTRGELHELQTRTAREKTGIDSSAMTVRAEDGRSFEDEREELQKELDQAKATLALMRVEHNENEAAMYKGKKREQHDVESVIAEYDGDMGSKEDEYQEANKEYQEVLTKLELLTKEYREMNAGRMAHEEREREAAARKLEEGLKAVRQNRAARVIQGAFKAMKAKRAADAKKAKKAAAKGKKK
ncbi:hypothetical protein FOA52_003472 [Chlamydomonas sp. UWO 241]|nr:hypothetical protein FOA52_003472 [Chlamydomonas sp. UWO 241]